MDELTKSLSKLNTMIQLAKQDVTSEFECKLLQGKIQTKDVADRLLKTLVQMSPVKESAYMTISYQDGTRVVVNDTSNVNKLCANNSFVDVSLRVERKQEYDDNVKSLVLPEIHTKFTLRRETFIRNDWEGKPADPKGYIRMIYRKTFRFGVFNIDFSLIKTRPQNSKQSIRDMLKSQHTYELEIELSDETADLTTITDNLTKIIHTLLKSYYQTNYLLTVSEQKAYLQEFQSSNQVFINPVTMIRKHMMPDNEDNILKDYTVTVKADGVRAGLFVANDRHLLKIGTNLDITRTGIVANSDKHVGDFIDGEFISEHSLFSVFDIYKYCGKNTRHLPLMLDSDEATIKHADKSRLGYMRTFVNDLSTEFSTVDNLYVRIETKMFLAGDGLVMENAINTILNTQFPYETDGLIFTPRNSPVAPSDSMRGNTWLKVYKWKPASQNSIDFLVQILPEETFDAVNKIRVKRGELYVSRTPGTDIIYPRETMTGEYEPKKLSPELERIASKNTRIPSLFQPSMPRNIEAYNILIPIGDKGYTVDKNNEKIEHNTIIECSYDLASLRWVILRTRYDKTYKYRVENQPQYGNDIATADSIWTSIHFPITDEMIRNIVTNPLVDDIEDTYYKDDLKRSSRVFSDVYKFHNKIKDSLYDANVIKHKPLLELASGRGGDLMKWKRTHPELVVAVDISLSNIISPKQGAAARYLTYIRENPKQRVPKCLFVEGDMCQYPLLEQPDRYMKILTGKETAQTSYLKVFENVNTFDTISCQFALHYACKSEEVFRDFAKNLQEYGKNVFFGTCSDGQAIYSLLIGKKSHTFMDGKGVSGEYTKEYEDRESWTEEFGLPVKVFLESFDKPMVEYLVPFEKVTTILKEYNYDLVETSLFSEHYARQTEITLTANQQLFSFLNRSFVFRRNNEETKTPKPEKVKLQKPDEKPETTPVLFSGADESKGAFRRLSNMSSDTVEINGEVYPTVEHYFQAMKAREFGDEESYKRIISAKTPKAAKALGKKVKGYNQDKWDEVRYSHMALGVRTKFVQHEEARRKLEETGDRPIGFADARNTYWGIGTADTTEKSKHPEKWRGLNMLGKLLVKLRDEFKNE